jgi:hypothetical protein
MTREVLRSVIAKVLFFGELRQRLFNVADSQVMASIKKVSGKQLKGEQGILRQITVAGLSRIMLAGFVLFLWTPAVAQEIEFASSPNPVGSGARALGMGGAFIAVADDATAASWNPGGLIQLELPEVSIVGTGYARSEDNTFGGHPEADGTQSSTDVNLNYLSAAYPFTLFDRNMIVALTYQHIYDFNRSWQFNFRYDENGLMFDRSVDYSQEGGLSAIGLSYTIQIIPALSVGITMNIWDDDIGNNHWKQDTYYTAPGSFGAFELKEFYHRIDQYSFQGLNCNIGLLWRFNESLTVGAVFKTPFTANVKHDFTLRNSIDQVTPPAGPVLVVEENGSFAEKMDMPASYGVGASYRFSDAFTVAFDIYRTEWGDMIYTDHEGVSTSAISSVEENRSNIGATVQIRAGAEYLVIKPKYLVPLRVGFFYDPAPSEGGNDDLYGFTLGSGFARGQFVLDVGYQFRFGNNVGSAIFKSGALSQDVREHTLYTSLIVHF